MPARFAWLMIGLLSLSGGIAGVILPLVPTTPFLLVAAFAFARSSPSLHEWLVLHPRLGPPIQDWHAHGAISQRTKVAAMTAMALALALSAAAGVSMIVILIQIFVILGVAVFILTRPSGPHESLRRGAKNG